MRYAEKIMITHEYVDDMKGVIIRIPDEEEVKCIKFVSYNGKIIFSGSWEEELPGAEWTTIEN